MSNFIVGDLEEQLTTNKKPVTIDAMKLAEVTMSKVKETPLKEPKVLRFFSIGIEDGKHGLYTIEFDVANESLVSYNFAPELSRGEAVERFKINAAGIFRGV